MTGSKMDQKESDNISTAALLPCTQAHEAHLYSLWLLPAFKYLMTFC